MDHTDSFVIVGRVARPFGIKGWNHLTSYTQPPENLVNYKPWALGSAEGESVTWELIVSFNTQTMNKGLVVRINECNNRDDAAVFVNRLIGTPRSSLPEPSSNEHYWVDLVGCEVENTDGETLGTVQDISLSSAHEIIHVSSENSEEHLIPLVDEYVVKIEPRKRLIVTWQKDWS